MISNQFAQLGFWIRALIGGVQPYMVGGPPSHCAIKIEVGAGGSLDEVD